MKTPSSRRAQPATFNIQHSKFKIPHPPGFALVTVLALVVVLVVVVVALAQLATSQRRASSIDHAIFSNQALADMAVNLVTAQIRTGTTQPDNVAWVSQPGLIRTYSGAGQMTNAYKLYSARKMVATGDAELDADLATESSPAGWAARPAVWHDLNAPVTVPAADPAQADSTAYPILDPRALGQVEGFTFNGSTSAVAEIPMPVQWMYVLADGNVVAPDPAVGDGKKVTLPGASATNPPVGRIAFWTDDDTCKVNVNTAGYAKNDANYWTYWDTPFVSTYDEEWMLSARQPWTFEYQRYPGHPATTGLNAVFESLNLTDDQILSLTTPFYRAGGTRGGTIPISEAAVPPTQAQTNALIKADPLFASVDELFYAPDRGLRANGISRDDLERRRFFLTAHSRAPEANLFNMPRVTIWPNWQTASKRSTMDRLIAFCSTIGNQPYYFVRENAYVTNELTGIAQNMKIYNYLSALTSNPIPGVGSQTFANKFGTQRRDQILTSIFDATRLVNIDDRAGTGGDGSGYSFTAGHFNAANSNAAKVPDAPADVNVGYVAPTIGPNNTRSPGRAYTLAEVAIQFWRYTDNSAEERVHAMMLYGFAVPATGAPLPGQNCRIEVSGLDGFKVRVNPTDGNSTTQLFTTGNFSNTQIDRGHTFHFRRGLGEGTGFVRTSGIEWTMSAQTSAPTPGSNGALVAFTPLLGSFDLPLDPNGSFHLTAATLHIDVYSPASSTTPWQRYSIAFPEADVLVPMSTSYPDDSRYNENSGYTFHLSRRGDSILAMQNRSGDYRTESVRSGVISDFRPHVRYGDILPLSIPGFHASDVNMLAVSRRASSLRWDGSPDFDQDYRNKMIGALSNDQPNYGVICSPNLPTRPGDSDPGVWRSIADAYPPGEFSNGIGTAYNGAWLPKSDEGRPILGWGNTGSGGEFPVFLRASDGLGATPYFRSSNTQSSDTETTMSAAETTLASPNRQLASAVYFGSIPTDTWQTLLFRPAVSYHFGGTGHFGATSPPDYYLLDLFHMPVVEPYAISEPFSTAGKINMNARLVPFSSVVRETGLRAVLESTRLIAIPDSVAGRTGAGDFSVITTPPPSVQTRFPLNLDETLKGFTARYDATSGPPVFLSAAEICTIPLVPEGSTLSGLSSFWTDKKPTGDNALELPYSSLLPRLTTKSNVFTVHYTVQTLKRVPGGVANQWDEDRDKVVGEQRGSTTLERYIDPNDPEFSEFQYDFAAHAGDANPPTLGRFYKFRTVASQQFRP